MGFQIFLHSVRMVFGNFKELLRISLVPALIGAAALILLFMSIESSVADAPYNPPVSPEALNETILFVLLATIGGVLVSLWIVVNWHRFILLEEIPTGWLPQIHFGRIMSYIGHALLLGLIFFAGMVPVILIGALLGANGLSPIIVLFFVICASLILWRVIIILPAAAIGKSMGLREAWGATEGHWGAIIAVFFIGLVFQTVIQLVFAGLQYLMPVVGTFLILIPSVFILPLINVSILTTMYGVFVEGRSLD